GAGRDQQGSAVLHIFCDVIVVEDRQNIAMLIAVEDDQVEIVDLLDEQLARRKGNEREFVDRCSVLLFRRAQNGEMHEVDGSIRLQEVAPRALARMRLARNEQNTQVL